MADRVVHHYPALPSVTRYAVPAGAKIVGALRRPGGGIAVYVEHSGGPTTDTLDVVFIGTGQEFDLPALDHIATVLSDPFVWHVYGKVEHG